MREYEVKYFTEGILSDTWQIWCNFCRELILLSCRGTIGKNGNVYTARNSDNSWSRIGYEARQTVYNCRTQQNGKINYLRNEPTWGDIDKIIDIIYVLKPSNANILLSSFGVPLTGPKHLQMVRNAAQHKNWETMTNISSVSIQYTTSHANSPVYLSWEIDVKKNELAYLSWTDDLEVIATFACN